MELENIIVNVVLIGLVLVLILFSRWMWYLTPRYISSWEGIKRASFSKITKVKHTYNVAIDIVVDLEADESLEALGLVIEQFRQEVDKKLWHANIEITGRTTEPWFL